MPNPDPTNNMTNLTDQDLIELQWMAGRDLERNGKFDEA